MVNRPKHSPKVHVWAGMFAEDVMAIVIFTGILTATRYTDILDVVLLLFIEEHYPTHHRFQQDNDPRHTSRWSQDYFQEKNINWWKTPACSSDLKMFRGQ